MAVIPANAGISKDFISIVIPANAGISKLGDSFGSKKIPAFAGMTNKKMI